MASARVWLSRVMNDLMHRGGRHSCRSDCCSLLPQRHPDHVVTSHPAGACTGRSESVGGCRSCTITVTPLLHFGANVVQPSSPASPGMRQAGNVATQVGSQSLFSAGGQKAFGPRVCLSAVRRACHRPLVFAVQLEGSCKVGVRANFCTLGREATHRQASSVVLAGRVLRGRSRGLVSMVIRCPRS